MQPNQPYDFSVPQQLPPDPTAKVKRIITVAGIGFIVFIVLLVAMSFIFREDSLSEELSAIAAQNNEVARVALFAVESERSSSGIKNHAATTQASSLTYVSQLAKYGARTGSPVINLDSAYSAEADKRLESAAKENRFDEEYNEIMTIMLNTVNQEIVTFAQANETDQELRKILQFVLDGNSLLLEDLDA